MFSGLRQLVNTLDTGDLDTVNALNRCPVPYPAERARLEYLEARFKQLVNDMSYMRSELGKTIEKALDSAFHEDQETPMSSFQKLENVLNRKMQTLFNETLQHLRAQAEEKGWTNENRQIPIETKKNKKQGK